MAMSISQDCKLRNTRQFNVVYKSGKSVVTKLMVMYYVRNNLETNRVGYSVSKKVGKSVIRNRVKRLMKEAYRLNFSSKKIGYDIVFIARVRMNSSTYVETEKTMKYLLKRLGE